jgi:hypothetical protein
MNIYIDPAWLQFTYGCVFSSVLWLGLLVIAGVASSRKRKN